MVKQFFIQCMLFQSKERLHIRLGIFCWLNVLQAVLSVSSILLRH